MKKLMELFIICIVFQTLNSRAIAQSDYQTQGILYKDQYVTVELQIKLNDPCSVNGKKSKFRYVITGSSRGYNQYLNWKLKYYDCDSRIISQNNFLNIGVIEFEGINEFIDWTFDGNKIASIDRDSNKVTSNPLRIPSAIVTPAKSERAKYISGNLNINYGESTTLTAEGGILGVNARWKWYTNGCGIDPIGVGQKAITINPLENTEYFLRAESPNDTTVCVSVEVKVNLESIAADKIEGRSIICKGEKNIQLKVKGGKLGKEADWVWYEENINSTPIGKGGSILINPEKNTNYYVRAESKANITSEKSISIKIVEEKLQDPTSIIGDYNICKGNDLILKASGGLLSGNAEWCWYQNNISPGSLVGKGESIRLTPSNSTIYYLRGEGVCMVTKEKSIVIKVNSVSSAPAGILNRTDNAKKKKTILTVSGGVLGENAVWKWYKKDCEGRSIGEGQSISVRVRKTTVFFVKAEGTCNNTSCINTTVYPTYQKRFVFINFGVVPNLHVNEDKGVSGTLQASVKKTSENPVASLTFGSFKKSGWYFRGKYNVKYKKTEYIIKNNEINNTTNSANYYVYNGETSENRWSFTGGWMRSLNRKRSIIFQLGAGYGQRDLLWGINEYSNQNNSLIKKGWGKQNSESFSGMEIESGLMLRFFIFNIMAGGNGIIPINGAPAGSTYKTYIDLYIGIGFTF